MTISTVSILIALNALLGSTYNFDCNSFNQEEYDKIYLVSGISRLNISECSKVKNLPSNIELMKIDSLSFFWNGIGNEQIDFSPIGKIEQLKFLNLGPYSSIQELPVSFRNLKNLKFLNVSLTELRKLPEWIHELEKMEVLNISMTSIDQLPTESLAKMKNLYELNLMDCEIELTNVELEELRNYLRGVLIKY